MIASPETDRSEKKLLKSYWKKSFCGAFFSIYRQDKIFVLFASMDIYFPFLLLLVCPGSSNRYVFYGNTPQETDKYNKTKMRLPMRQHFVMETVCQKGEASKSAH